MICTVEIPKEQHSNASYVRKSYSSLSRVHLAVSVEFRPKQKLLVKIEFIFHYGPQYDYVIT